MIRRSPPRASTWSRSTSTPSRTRSPRAAGTRSATRSPTARSRSSASHFPNLPGSILERQVLAPPDLERVLGIWGGHALHGEMAFDQLFNLRPVRGWGEYRTPIRDLWICGAGTHPGGGVTGANGRNCAREVIREARGLRAEDRGSQMSPLYPAEWDEIQAPVDRDRAARDRRSREVLSRGRAQRLRGPLGGPGAAGARPQGRLDRHRRGRQRLPRLRLGVRLGAAGRGPAGADRACGRGDRAVRQRGQPRPGLRAHGRPRRAPARRRTGRPQPLRHRPQRDRGRRDRGEADAPSHRPADHHRLPRLLPRRVDHDRGARSRGRRDRQRTARAGPRIRPRPLPTPLPDPVSRSAARRHRRLDRRLPARPGPLPCPRPGRRRGRRDRAGAGLGRLRRARPTPSGRR